VAEEWLNETVQLFLSSPVSLRHSASVPVLLPTSPLSDLVMHHAQSFATSGVSPFSPSPISAQNLAVDNHTVYTPTLYYHYTPHYT